MGLLFLYITLGVAGLFLIPLVFALLWDATMPELFGLKEISYWQSFRLLLITSILFGGGIIGHFTIGR